MEQRKSYYRIKTMRELLEWKKSYEDLQRTRWLRKMGPVKKQTDTEIFVDKSLETLQYGKLYKGSNSSEENKIENDEEEIACPVKKQTDTGKVLDKPLEILQNEEQYKGSNSGEENRIENDTEEIACPVKKQTNTEQVVDKPLEILQNEEHYKGSNSGEENQIENDKEEIACQVKKQTDTEKVVDTPLEILQNEEQYNGSNSGEENQTENYTEEIACPVKIQTDTGKVLDKPLEILQNEEQYKGSISGEENQIENDKEEIACQVKKQTDTEKVVDKPLEILQNEEQYNGSNSGEENQTENDTEEIACPVKKQIDTEEVVDKPLAILQNEEEYEASTSGEKNKIGNDKGEIACPVKKQIDTEKFVDESLETLHNEKQHTDSNYGEKIDEENREELVNENIEVFYSGESTSEDESNDIYESSCEEEENYFSDRGQSDEEEYASENSEMSRDEGQSTTTHSDDDENPKEVLDENLDNQYKEENIPEEEYYGYNESDVEDSCEDSSDAENGHTDVQQFHQDKSEPSHTDKHFAEHSSCEGSNEEGQNNCDHQYDDEHSWRRNSFTENENCDNYASGDENSKEVDSSPEKQCDNDSKGSVAKNSEEQYNDVETQYHGCTMDEYVLMKDFERKLSVDESHKTDNEESEIFEKYLLQPFSNITDNKCTPNIDHSEQYQDVMIYSFDNNTSDKNCQQLNDKVDEIGEYNMHENLRMYKGTFQVKITGNLWEIRPSIKKDRTNTKSLQNEKDYTDRHSDVFSKEGNSKEFLEAKIENPHCEENKTGRTLEENYDDQYNDEDSCRGISSNENEYCENYASGDENSKYVDHLSEVQYDSDSEGSIVDNPEEQYEYQEVQCDTGRTLEENHDDQHNDEDSCSEISSNENEYCGNYASGDENSKYVDHLSEVQYDSDSEGSIVDNPEEQYEYQEVQCDTGRTLEENYDDQHNDEDSCSEISSNGNEYCENYASGDENSKYVDHLSEVQYDSDSEGSIVDHSEEQYEYQEVQCDTGRTLEENYDDQHNDEDSCSEISSNENEYCENYASGDENSKDIDFLSEGQYDSDSEGSIVDHPEEQYKYQEAQCDTARTLEENYDDHQHNDEDSCSEISFNENENCENYASGDENSMEVESLSEGQYDSDSEVSIVDHHEEKYKYQETQCDTEEHYTECSTEEEAYEEYKEDENVIARDCERSLSVDEPTSKSSGNKEFHESSDEYSNQENYPTDKGSSDEEECEGENTETPHNARQSTGTYSDAMNGDENPRELFEETIDNQYNEENISEDEYIGYNESDVEDSCEDSSDAENGHTDVQQFHQDQSEPSHIDKHFAEHSSCEGSNEEGQNNCDHQYDDEHSWRGNSFTENENCDNYASGDENSKEVDSSPEKQCDNDSKGSVAKNSEKQYNDVETQYHGCTMDEYVLMKDFERKLSVDESHKTDNEESEIFEKYLLQPFSNITDNKCTPNIDHSEQYQDVMIYSFDNNTSDKNCQQLNDKVDEIGEYNMHENLRMYKRTFQVKITGNLWEIRPSIKKDRTNTKTLQNEKDYTDRHSDVFSKEGNSKEFLEAKIENPHCEENKTGRTLEENYDDQHNDEDSCSEISFNENENCENYASGDENSMEVESLSEGQYDSDSEGSIVDHHEEKYKYQETQCDTEEHYAECSTEEESYEEYKEDENVIAKDCERSLSVDEPTSKSSGNKEFHESSDEYSNQENYPTDKGSSDEEECEGENTETPHNARQSTGTYSDAMNGDENPRELFEETIDNQYNEENISEDEYNGYNESDVEDSCEDSSDAENGHTDVQQFHQDKSEPSHIDKHFAEHSSCEGSNEEGQNNCDHQYDDEHSWRGNSFTENENCDNYAYGDENSKEVDSSPEKHCDNDSKGSAAKNSEEQYNDVETQYHGCTMDEYFLMKDFERKLSVDESHKTDNEESEIFEKYLLQPFSNITDNKCTPNIDHSEQYQDVMIYSFDNNTSDKNCQQLNDKVDEIGEYNMHENLRMYKGTFQVKITGNLWEIRPSIKKDRTNTKTLQNEKDYTDRHSDVFSKEGNSKEFLEAKIENPHCEENKTGRTLEENYEDQHNDEDSCSEISFNENENCENYASGDENSMEVESLSEGQYDSDSEGSIVDHHEEKYQETQCDTEEHYAECSTEEEEAYEEYKEDENVIARDCERSLSVDEPTSKSSGNKEFHESSDEYSNQENYPTDKGSSDEEECEGENTETPHNARQSTGTYSDAINGDENPRELFEESIDNQYNEENISEDEYNGYNESDAEDACEETLDTEEGHTDDQQFNQDRSEPSHIDKYFAEHSPCVGSNEEAQNNGDDQYDDEDSCRGNSCTENENCGNYETGDENSKKVDSSPEEQCDSDSEGSMVEEDQCDTEEHYKEDSTDEEAYEGNKKEENDFTKDFDGKTSVDEFHKTVNEEREISEEYSLQPFSNITEKIASNVQNSEQYQEVKISSNDNKASDKNCQQLDEKVYKFCGIHLPEAWKIYKETFQVKKTGNLWETRPSLKQATISKNIQSDVLHKDGNPQESLDAKTENQDYEEKISEGEHYEPFLEAHVGQINQDIDEPLTCHSSSVQFNEESTEELINVNTRSETGITLAENYDNQHDDEDSCNEISSTENVYGEQSASREENLKEDYCSEEQYESDSEESIIEHSEGQYNYQEAQCDPIFDAMHEDGNLQESLDAKIEDEYCEEKISEDEHYEPFLEAHILQINQFIDAHLTGHSSRVQVNEKSKTLAENCDDQHYEDSCNESSSKENEYEENSASVDENLKEDYCSEEQYESDSEESIIEHSEGQYNYQEAQCDPIFDAMHKDGNLQESLDAKIEDEYCEEKISEDEHYEPFLEAHILQINQYIDAHLTGHSSRVQVNEKSKTLAENCDDQHYEDSCNESSSKENEYEENSASVDENLKEDYCSEEQYESDSEESIIEHSEGQYNYQEAQCDPIFDAMHEDGNLQESLDAKIEDEYCEENISEDEHYEPFLEAHILQINQYIDAHLTGHSSRVQVNEKSKTLAENCDDQHDDEDSCNESSSKENEYEENSASVDENLKEDYCSEEQYDIHFEESIIKHPEEQYKYEEAQCDPISDVRHEDGNPQESLHAKIENQYCEENISEDEHYEPFLEAHIRQNNQDLDELLTGHSSSVQFNEESTEELINVNIRSETGITLAENYDDQDVDQDSCSETSSTENEYEENSESGDEQFFSCSEEQYESDSEGSIIKHPKEQCNYQETQCDTEEHYKKYSTDHESNEVDKKDEAVIANEYERISIEEHHENDNEDHEVSSLQPLQYEEQYAGSLLLKENTEEKHCEESTSKANVHNDFYEAKDEYSYQDNYTTDKGSGDEEEFEDHYTETLQNGRHCTGPISDAMHEDGNTKELHDTKIQDPVNNITSDKNRQQFNDKVDEFGDYYSHKKCRILTNTFKLRITGNSWKLRPSIKKVTKHTDQLSHTVDDPNCNSSRKIVVNDQFQVNINTNIQIHKSNAIVPTADIDDDLESTMKYEEINHSTIVTDCLSVEKDPEMSSVYEGQKRSKENNCDNIGRMEVIGNDQFQENFNTSDETVDCIGIRNSNDELFIIDHENTEKLTGTHTGAQEKSNEKVKDQSFEDSIEIENFERDNNRSETGSDGFDLVNQEMEISTRVREISSENVKDQNFEDIIKGEKLVRDNSSSEIGSDGFDLVDQDIENSCTNVQQISNENVREESFESSIKVEKFEQKNSPSEIGSDDFDLVDQDIENTYTSVQEISSENVREESFEDSIKVEKFEQDNSPSDTASDDFDLVDQDIENSCTSVQETSSENLREESFENSNKVKKFEQDNSPSEIGSDDFDLLDQDIENRCTSVQEISNENIREESFEDSIKVEKFEQDNSPSDTASDYFDSVNQDMENSTRVREISSENVKDQSFEDIIKCEKLVKDNSPSNTASDDFDLVDQDIEGSCTRAQEISSENVREESFEGSSKVENLEQENSPSEIGSDDFDLVDQDIENSCTSVQEIYSENVRDQSIEDSIKGENLEQDNGSSEIGSEGFDVVGQDIENSVTSVQETSSENVRDQGIEDSIRVEKLEKDKGSSEIVSDGFDVLDQDIESTFEIIERFDIDVINISDEGADSEENANNSGWGRWLPFL